ncbi:glycoside hydrolase family 16 protein [Athelia psychrophila]|uniref:Glycoside hydrolase family 16 protein n=1 Tax=Athelia psychrophila TaxID=1759441 RepID=A0A165XPR6_9AGAM|nr:glycoside hydrolase family 16 protein [Fibularhizoctonia sp. CBS 109695]
MSQPKLYPQTPNNAPFTTSSFCHPPSSARGKQTFISKTWWKFSVWKCLDSAVQKGQVCPGPQIVSTRYSQIKQPVRECPIITYVTRNPLSALGGYNIGGINGAKSNGEELRLFGQVSQSGQWAPFTGGYIWPNTSANLIIPTSSISVQNPYRGESNPQATSVVTDVIKSFLLNFDYQGRYQTGTQYFINVYGIEYRPGFDDAYISWIANGTVAWTINAGCGGQYRRRHVCQARTPGTMYLLMNLGNFTNFGTVDTKHIPYPVTIHVDYIRVIVYQPKDAINYGCDPNDLPAAAKSTSERPSLLHFHCAKLPNCAAAPDTLRHTRILI